MKRATGSIAAVIVIAAAYLFTVSDAGAQQETPAARPFEGKYVLVYLKTDHRNTGR